MSCPAGKPSISALAVKSDSGSASTKTVWWMVLKLSVVAISANMRAGRLARAQITAESTETSPDWMPWVMSGRSAARLRWGLPTPPTAEIALDAAVVAKKRRRDTNMRIVMEILAWKKEPKKRPFSQNADSYAIPS